METNSYPVDIAVPEADSRSTPALTALLEGARNVLRLWPVLLLMFLGTILSAGLLALIPALNLFAFAHRPAVEQMAAGIPSWMVVDLLGLTNSPQPAVGGPVTGQLTMTLLGFVLMPLVGGLVSAFLYGGVLFSYKEKNAGDRFKRFLWGSWHWFGSFLGLGLLQALLLVGLGLPFFGLLRFLFVLAGAGMWIAVILTLVIAIFWLAIFELTRVRLVLDGIRNPFIAIGRAMKDLGRRPLALLVFYAAALLALVLVQVVFRLVINPRVPLDALLLAVSVQQAFILARLFCQAMRLAGLMVLLR